MNSMNGARRDEMTDMDYGESLDEIRHYYRISLFAKHKIQTRQLTAGLVLIY